MHTHARAYAERWVNAPLSFIAYLQKIKRALDDHPTPPPRPRRKQVLTQYVSVRVRRAYLHSARDRSLYFFFFFFFFLLIMVFRPSGSQVLRFEIAAGDRSSNVVYFARSLIFKKKSVSMKYYARAIQDILIIFVFLFGLSRIIVL